jgi:hypothetical protein
MHVSEGKKDQGNWVFKEVDKETSQEVVKEKKLTLASPHYPLALNCLMEEVILMIVKCAYALSLSHA